MLKKVILLCCVFLLFIPILAFAQSLPPESFRRELLIDPTIFTVTATQSSPSTNESYTIQLQTFPFSDGDPGVTYNNKGEIVSVTLFKIPFSVTKIDSENGANCPDTIQRTIRVNIDYASSQLKIDNRPDVNDLLHFAAGSSVDQEVSAFLNTLIAYFPYNTTPETLSAALGGLSDFYYQHYQTYHIDGGGGVVAVVIIGLVCLWKCPEIIGCAIGAGGFNIYWAQCVGVAPDTN